MPSEPPNDFNPPAWLLSTVAGLALTIAGWSVRQSIANEHRLTVVEGWKTEHAVAADRTWDAHGSRLRELEKTQSAQTEELRRLLADVREDVAAIRGALNIPKSK